jgi:hypothetical protein
LFQLRGTIATSVNLSISDEQRADLLRRAVAREFVQVSIDIVAYEQSPGRYNRKGVRFDQLARVAPTAVGAPYLRDHDQGCGIRGIVITETAAS